MPTVSRVHSSDSQIFVNNVKLTGIQSFSIDSSRDFTELPALGSLGTVDRIMNSNQTIGVSLNFIPADNKALLGGERDVNDPFFSHTTGGLISVDNFDLKFKDIAGQTEVGNCYLTSYSIKGAVNEMVNGSIAYEGDVITFNTGTYSTYSDQSDDDYTVFRPQEITINTDLKEGVNTSSYCIQSFDFTVPIQRTPVKRLGQRTPSFRYPTFPVNGDLKFSILKNKLTGCDLSPLVLEKGNITINLNDLGKDTIVEYNLSNCSLVSVSESQDLDSNATFDFGYTFSADSTLTRNLVPSFGFGIDFVANYERTLDAKASIGNRLKMTRSDSSLVYPTRVDRGGFICTARMENLFANSNPSVDINNFTSTQLNELDPENGTGYLLISKAGSQRRAEKASSINLTDHAKTFSVWVKKAEGYPLPDWIALVYGDSNQAYFRTSDWSFPKDNAKNQERLNLNSYDILTAQTSRTLYGGVITGQNNWYKLVASFDASWDTPNREFKVVAGTGAFNYSGPIDDGRGFVMGSQQVSRCGIHKHILTAGTPSGQNSYFGAGSLPRFEYNSNPYNSQAKGFLTERSAANLIRKSRGESHGSMMGSMTRTYTGHRNGIDLMRIDDNNESSNGAGISFGFDLNLSSGARGDYWYSFFTPSGNPNFYCRLSLQNSGAAESNYLFDYSNGSLMWTGGPTVSSSRLFVEDYNGLYRLHYRFTCSGNGTNISGVGGYMQVYPRFYDSNKVIFAPSVTGIGWFLGGAQIERAGGAGSEKPSSFLPTFSESATYWNSPTTRTVDTYTGFCGDIFTGREGSFMVNFENKFADSYNGVFGLETINARNQESLGCIINQNKIESSCVTGTNFKASWKYEKSAIQNGQDIKYCINFKDDSNALFMNSSSLDKASLIDGSDKVPLNNFNKFIFGQNGFSAGPQGTNATNFKSMRLYNKRISDYNSKRLTD
jgi:hypothetical protein